jgi:hypothetical protein
MKLQIEITVDDGARYGAKVISESKVSVEAEMISGAALKAFTDIAANSVAGKLDDLIMNPPRPEPEPQLPPEPPPVLAGVPREHDSF